MYKTPQVCLDNMINDFTSLVERKMDIVKTKIESIIRHDDLPSDVHNSLKGIFTNQTLTNPFAGLETRYLQDKYIEENFGLVVNLYCVLNVNLCLVSCLHRFQWKSK